MRPKERSHENSDQENIEAKLFLCQLIADNLTQLLNSGSIHKESEKLYLFGVIEPHLTWTNRYLVDPLTLISDKLFQNCNVTFSSYRFSYEKAADNASGAYCSPCSNFRRMQCFLFTQMRIFGIPKSPVLFINDSIQMKMCLICEPDAAHIKSVVVDHC